MPPNIDDLKRRMKKLLDDGYDGQHARKFRHLQGIPNREFGAPGIGRLSEDVASAEAEMRDR